MSLPDDNSPAIVNLALIGGTGDQMGTSIRLSENLHKFKYDLIKDGDGKSSFTFTIEFINANDSFTESLLSLYSANLKGNPRNLDEITSGLLEGVDAGTFSNVYFPKLLIQWGYDYESDISKSGVHVAQITNVEYKFTQGKEKVFIISAVNTAKAYGELIKNQFTTDNYPVELDVQYGAIQAPEEKDPDHNWYESYNIKIENKFNETIGFTKIIQDQLVALLGSIPGTNSIPIPFDLSDDTYFDELFKEVYVGLNTSPEIGIGGRNPARGDQPPSYIYQERQRSKVQYAYEAVRQLLGNMGCDIHNPVQDTSGQSFISITKDYIKDKNTHGFSTEIVSPSQTANNGNLTKVYKAIEMDLSPNAVTKDFKYGTSKDGGSDSEHDELIEKGVEYWWDSYSYFPPIGSNEYNNDNWNFEFDALVEYSYLRINISKQHMESAKALEAEGIYIKSDIKLIIDIPSAIHNLPPALSTRLGIYSSQEILYSKELAAASNIAGVFLAAESTYFNQLTGTLKTLLELQAELRAAKEKAQQDLYEEGLGEVFSQAQIDALELEDMQNTTFNVKKYEELNSTERTDLHYDNLIVTTTSPENETVEDTALEIIKRYNAFVPDESYELDILSTNESFKESFEDILESFKSNKLKPLTDIYYIGRKKDLANLGHSSLRNYKDHQPGTITLNYGSGETEDNLVKYFDFKSDNRYLANLMATVMHIRSVKDLAQVLSYENITSKMGTWKKTLFNFYTALQNVELPDISKDSIETVLNILESGIVDPFQNNPSNFRIEDSDIADINVVIGLIEESLIITASNTFNLTNNFVNPELQSLYIFLEAITTPVLIAELLIAEDTQTAGNNQEDIAMRSYITDKFVENYTPAINDVFPYRELIRGSYYDEEIETSELTKNQKSDPVFYKLKNTNIFDNHTTMKSELKSQVDFFIKNITEAWEVRVKCIGIPIMDTHFEIGAPRVVKLNIEDFSPSNDSKNLINKYATGTHWLSGAYLPIAISHEINTAGGYTTELKLLKPPGKRK